MGTNYTEQMLVLDDFDLIQIVINRSDYESDAADAAIQEAQKRGLLNADLTPIQSLQEQVNEIPVIEEEKTKEKATYTFNFIVLFILGIVLLVGCLIGSSITKQTMEKSYFALWVGGAITVFLFIRAAMLYGNKNKDSNKKTILDEHEDIDTN